MTFLVVEGEELDVLGAGEGLAEVDELGEGVAVPGDDHGPGFDAAEAIDAGFERAVVEEVVDVDGLGLFDHAGDLDGPGAGLEAVGVVRGVGLAGAVLVKVVVGAGLVEGGLRLVYGVFAGDGFEWFGGVDGGCGIDQAGDGAGGEGSSAEGGSSGEEAAAALLMCSKTCCGVISEDLMVDSALGDLRRSIAWFPLFALDTTDMTPR